MKSLRGMLACLSEAIEEYSADEAEAWRAIALDEEETPGPPKPEDLRALVAAARALCADIEESKGAGAPVSVECHSCGVVEEQRNEGELQECWRCTSPDVTVEASAEGPLNQNARLFTALAPFNWIEV